MPADERFRYHGDAARRDAITAALERVIDPEMAIDIVGLGLVHEVASDAAGTRVTLTMTSAACPVSELIVEDIEHELHAALGGAHEVRVTLCWDPPWSPERLSARARQTLGWE